MEELTPYLGIVAACRITGRSRATHHRRLNPAPPRPKAPRPTPVNALSDTERQAVLELMNRPEYVDLPPA
ncbi:IS3 family transposase, partial [Streptomyces sp. MUM 136J]|nr:IS3 family transposase [Streptomyces sp. MUM 2J]MCH0573526.1 IS3 family transposase [Streptomyces sp. MUM 136J]